jgi:hypothetical protein
MQLLEGPIDGNVGGDVFTFRLAGRATDGEFTVSGDEMKGYLHIGSRIPLTLRRLDASPPRSP